jgi:dUTP diphosphatase
MRVKLLSSIAKLPLRGSPAAAGWDLFATTRAVVPGTTVTKKKVNIGRALIPTGVAVAIPFGFVGHICSRSGLSVRHNIEVGAGWVDSDYRGEIYVELKNFSGDDFHIKRGMRVAQLIVLKLNPTTLHVAKSLPRSKRSSHALGSTGMY